MKVEMVPQIHPRRGGEVKVGNVYTNAHGRPHYKIVVGIIKRGADDRPWNNVVCIHVNHAGEIIGCSAQPVVYVSEHQDLIGVVKDMPKMKIQWLKEHEK